jgi:hypothetical protein
MHKVMRVFAAALAVLATATLAVGTPLCCLAEAGCCTEAKAAPASDAPHCPCCPAPREPAPAKKACECSEHEHHALLDVKDGHAGAPKLVALPLCDPAPEAGRPALPSLPSLRPAAPGAAPAPLSTPLLL